MSGIINGESVLTSRAVASFASGTKMIFNQTSAPTGWTKLTSSNDVALRLTSGSVGTGGTVAFETAFASQTPTISQPTASSGAVSAHTLAVSEMPSHAHSVLANTTHNGTDYVTKDSSSSGPPGDTSAAGGGGSHTHGFTQPTISQPTSSAINLDVSYVDVIIAEKD